MENLREALEESINEQLYQGTLSNARTGNTKINSTETGSTEISSAEAGNGKIKNAEQKEQAAKVKVRPIMYKGELCYQASSFVGTKVLHKNYTRKEMIAYIMENMQENFRQLEIENVRLKVTALVSKKGKVTVKKKRNAAEDMESAAKKIDLSHNRRKNYILEEGKPVDFLIDLGVQTPEGRIVKARYDKFKQINRFLEFLEDVLPALKKKEQITILDFGCGKSYLTFAMYYFLKELQKMNIRIIGLDLKTDVIEHCNRLSEKYGYESLHFLQGDISAYQGVTEVDMVVTLHACDTATDFALAKAIQWNASVILSVPCCQHEVNKQISCEELEPVLKYGLIRERMSALITDAYRGNILEKCGYDTQILEFIDMEHTPKNILIRAVKKPTQGKDVQKPEQRTIRTAQIQQPDERTIRTAKIQQPDERIIRTAKIQQPDERTIRTAEIQKPDERTIRTAEIQKPDERIIRTAEIQKSDQRTKEAAKIEKEIKIEQSLEELETLLHIKPTLGKLVNEINEMELKKRENKK